MSVIVKGNIARISDIQVYDDNGEDQQVLYVTVIDNHRRKKANGEYEDTGKTVYEVTFRGGIAMRVLSSFSEGQAVLVEADNQRTIAEIGKDGKAYAVNKVHGIDIGRSPRYKAFG